MKRVARSGVVSEIARISLLALVRVLGLWIGMEAKVTSAEPTKRPYL
jgi:hypothetical protein